MKFLLRSVLLFAAMPVFAETGLAGQNGFFYSIGVGISPIYIEEIASDSALSGGATVTAFNAESRVGLVFREEFAAYAMTSQNFYTDSEAQIYTTGLTGLGVQYFPENFFDTYVLLGAGLASKIVFTSNEMLSATGTGVQFGIGRAFSRLLALEANYKYLSLTKPALPFVAGDTEAISSIQISLHLLLP